MNRTDLTTEALYTRVNAEGERDENGRYMQFGSYPIRRTVHKPILAALNKLVPDKPTHKDSRGWSSYKYFSSGKNDLDYMWYRDIKFRGRQYRGVYFSDYRPHSADYECHEINSSQKNNEYRAGFVYWFTYLPLMWQIAEERGDKARLISYMTIDSQPYQNLCINESVWFYKRDSDGTAARDCEKKGIYANNYEHSSIREWLGDIFYNTAFTGAEQAIISLENTDNSLKSTLDERNPFICADTVDYVRLPSVEEALLIEGGEWGEPSDYALCQGLYSHADSCCRWLRSPGYVFSNQAMFIDYNGMLSYGDVSGANVGVCPSLWIQL